MKRILTSILLAVVVLAGCKSGPSLDGKWNVSGGNLSQMPPGSSATMEFSGSNFTMAMRTKDAQTGELGITVNGTYELKEKALKLTATDVKVDSSKVKPEVKAMVDQFVKPEDMKKQMNDASDFTVTFVSEKEVTLAGKNGSMTLKK